MNLMLLPELLLLQCVSMARLVELSNVSSQRWKNICEVSVPIKRENKLLTQAKWIKRNWKFIHVLS